MEGAFGWRYNTAITCGLEITGKKLRRIKILLDGNTKEMTATTYAKSSPGILLDYRSQYPIVSIGHTALVYILYNGNEIMRI